MIDDFWGAVKKDPSVEEAEAALEACENPNFESDFVASCREQFEEKGYLTPRQIEALQNIVENGPEFSGGTWGGQW